MTPIDLKAHKKASKHLTSTPVFKPQARNKLPKPFRKLGGPRIESTGMIDVAPSYVIFMYWRNGQIFTDRSFYAYLFFRLPNRDLSPLFEFHWHPSHKGFHCKTPCRTTSDYSNRVLVGAPELALSTNHNLDPKIHSDRMRLVSDFCKWCGVNLPDEDKNSLLLFQ